MVILLLNLALILILALVFIEDLLKRQVHLYLFVIGITIALIKSLSTNNSFSNILINASFIGLQIGTILVYGIIKGYGYKVFNRLFGIGDILMWGILVFLFSPLHFILFFVGSLFLSLLFHFLLSQFQTNQSILVPLAGNQSLCLLLLLTSQMLGWDINLYDDDICIKFLNNYGF
jgi:hypothetical protein